MKTLVILSGGMDSATVLYHIRNNANEVLALGIDYGQRHKCELDCAVTIAAELGVPFEVLDLSTLRNHLTGSSQTDDEVDVPKGHYEDESMKLTVVPNRNMIMIAAAAGVAIANGAEQIAYGAHSGDHAIYPDCRKEFVRAMQSALFLCHYKPGISMTAPFLDMDKGDIVIRGMELGVPFHLTHTCYEGKEIACGECGACQERIEAFKKAKTIDPINYGIAIDWEDCAEFLYNGSIVNGDSGS